MKHEFQMQMNAYRLNTFDSLDNFQTNKHRIAHSMECILITRSKMSAFSSFECNGRGCMAIKFDLCKIVSPVHAVTAVDFVAALIIGRIFFIYFKQSFNFP